MDGTTVSAQPLRSSSNWTRTNSKSGTRKSSRPGSAGSSDLNAYLDTAVFYEPRSFSRDEFFDFMLTQSQLLPDGAMGILKDLAASNQWMIGALNNEARETNEFRFGKFELRRYLKVALGLPATWDCASRSRQFIAVRWISSAVRHRESCSSTIEKRMWQLARRLE